MDIFSIITLFGGLAMFLYGMRLMGDGLKESSSGSLKSAMEKLTNTSLKAFLLGLVITAIIQSSTATIVITSGLVAAGIITIPQSLGVIVGANVGTTITGQIIRLLDLNASGTSILQFFKPSTLAPLALIIGIVLIMFCKFSSSNLIGQIAMGFGILFSGLLNMTDAVSVLADSGVFEKIFSSLGANPLLGYLSGFGVSFILQSSSASVGILQTFSTSGQLKFNGIYSILLGIYLGDCLTTALVCWIGARPDAKRVGVINVLFNLGKTVLTFTGVLIAHKTGLLDPLWNSVVDSGTIANTNTLFNLVCALLLLPVIRIFERMSYSIVREEKAEAGQYDELLDELNPLFYSTPSLAFTGCYDILMKMNDATNSNISDALNLLTEYDPKVFDTIVEKENFMDLMTDQVTNYLVQMSSHITASEHVGIMNHYLQVVSEFERLGDHAMNIAEIARELHDSDTSFSPDAAEELKVLEALLSSILEHTRRTFEKQDLAAARAIEPLEEVVDDLVAALKENHLNRLRKGGCSITAGTLFWNLLSDIERLSDICSNIGVETVARIEPEMNNQVHDYISQLHAGHNDSFNQAYAEAHSRYFGLLHTIEEKIRIPEN